MPHPTLTTTTPVLILLSLSLSILLLTSNCNAVRLGHSVSCPCSLIIKATHDAPAFLVRASSLSRHRTRRTQPLRLTGRPRGMHHQYFRALITDEGAFNVTLVPVHAHERVSSHTHRIISRQTTRTSTSSAPHNTCPVLFPQDLPMRFETRPVIRTAGSSTHGQDLSVDTRIVGGFEAGVEINKYTALINLDPSRWNSSCSGTLIGRSTVVTAAHCAVALNSVVYFGFVDRRNPGTKRLISDIRPHPLYNSSSVYNGPSSYDMSFITLSRPAPSSAKAMRLNYNPSIPMSSSIVRAGGYGRLSTNAPLPQALHQVDLKVLSSAECKGKFSRRSEYVRAEQVFCAVALDGADCSPW